MGNEYLPILIYLFLTFLIAGIILGASYLFLYQETETEKASAYECGFDPFEDARSSFDIRFYLVSILFIIFDLEIMFLFPWVLSLGQTTVYSFWVMFLFLFILTVGFVYEWAKGALEWE